MKRFNYHCASHKTAPLTSKTKSVFPVYDCLTLPKGLVPAVCRGGGTSVAFTLAEVLITLGIIGVVAAMTIPTLIQDYREKGYIAGLKKIYSTLSVVNQSVVAEHGSKYGCKYCIYSPENAPSNELFRKEIENKWLPYMNVVKTCNVPPRQGCFSTKAYDGINSKQYGWLNTTDAYLLKDGTAIKFMVSGNTGFEIIVDINGQKGPNKYGVDTFHFAMQENGREAIRDKILPLGSPLTGYNFSPHNIPCKRTVSASTQVQTCAAWVLEYENMDYLHCDDLKRGVKTKCK